MFDLKKSAIENGIAFIALFAILQIVFFKEQPAINFKLTFFIWLVLIMPGYIVVALLLKDESDPLIKIFLGAGIMTSIVVIFGYHLSYFGLHAKYLWFILPILTIGAAFLIDYIKENYFKKKQDQSKDNI